MSEATTPLRGNERGHGWHLGARRPIALRILAPLVGLVIVAFAVLGQVRGEAGLGVAVLVVLFGAAIAAVPFALEPARDVSPRTVEGADRSDHTDHTDHTDRSDHTESGGLLVPSPVLGPAAVGVFSVLGLAFLATAVGGVVLLVRGDVIERSNLGRSMPVPVGVAICVVLAALFLTGVVAIVRARRRDRGLLLTPERVVLPDGAVIEWAAIGSIGTFWTRPGGSSARSPILNWFVFDVPAARAPSGSRLLERGRSLTGLDVPVLSVAATACPPPVVLELLRYYLDHPPARGELGTDRARARYDRIAGSNAP